MSAAESLRHVNSGALSGAAPDQVVSDHVNPSAARPGSSGREPGPAVLAPAASMAAPVPMKAAFIIR
ncbi:MAG: hypothetical protein H6890_03100 [Brucellaceae bacterium]|nr:hypothetical protein [Brucellaceae bacterium]